MNAWWELEPLNVESLLALAARSVAEARPLVDAEAEVSHVGFRSQNREQWQKLQALLKPCGEVHMTYKETDGRKIPFVELDLPLEIGGDVLAYVEMPEPKKELKGPAMVVVFRHPTAAREAQFLESVEVRQQTRGAEDFIAQDNKEIGIA